MALSKYATRESAAADVLLLLKELARRVEALRSRVKWTEELGQKSLHAYTASNEMDIVPIGATTLEPRSRPSHEEA